jgi:hypothetical protein
MPLPSSSDDYLTSFLTSGYTVVSHRLGASALLVDLTSTISHIRSEHRARPSMCPSDESLTFGYIFQQHPKANGDANFGDYKRLSCFGLPYGVAPHVGTDVAWVVQARSLGLSVAQECGLEAILGSRIHILENSVLKTLTGAANQIGHYDLTVTAPPTLNSSPPAVIMLTPLDRASSLRILPADMCVERLPTHEEFEVHAIPVHVKVGESLLMRYDMAHSGTNAPGLRLHTVLSSLSISDLHELGFTHTLARSLPTKTSGKRRLQD